MTEIPDKLKLGVLSEYSVPEKLYFRAILSGTDRETAEKLKSVYSLVCNHLSANLPGYLPKDEVRQVKLVIQILEQAFKINEGINAMVDILKYGKDISAATDF
ncbi:Uncharacterised protein [uncultured archaeon]|nr:Uncharacterised protein [uncultured archaeon]